MFSSHLYCQVLTSVSASKNTHLVYCVRVQQWSLVKVTPSSGRRSQVRWALSLLSNTSTTTTSSNTYFRANLGKCIKINEPKKSKTIQDRWEANQNKINVALKTNTDLQKHGKVLLKSEYRMRFTLMLFQNEWWRIVTLSPWCSGNTGGNHSH